MKRYMDNKFAAGGSYEKYPGFVSYCQKLRVFFTEGNDLGIRLILKL